MRAPGRSPAGPSMRTPLAHLGPLPNQHRRRSAAPAARACPAGSPGSSASAASTSSPPAFDRRPAPVTDVEVALQVLGDRADVVPVVARSRGRGRGRRGRAAPGRRRARSRRTARRGSSRRSRGRGRRSCSWPGRRAPRPGPASPGSPGRAPSEPVTTTPYSLTFGDPLDRQGRDPAVRLVGVAQRRQVDVGERVSGHHHERLALAEEVARRCERRRRCPSSSSSTM